MRIECMTHRLLPFHELHQLFVDDMRLFTPSLDALREFILIPEKNKKDYLFFWWFIIIQSTYGIYEKFIYWFI